MFPPSGKLCLKNHFFIFSLQQACGTAVNTRISVCTDNTICLLKQPRSVVLMRLVLSQAAATLGELLSPAHVASLDLNCSGRDWHFHCSTRAYVSRMPPRLTYWCFGLPEHTLCCVVRSRPDGLHESDKLGLRVHLGCIKRPVMYRLTSWSKLTCHSGAVSIA